MRLYSLIRVIAIILMLTSCTGYNSGQVVTSIVPVPSRLKPYPNQDQFLYCVPFARIVSGIKLRGDAWTWWQKANGRYKRGNVPQEGAVLVFKKAPRLALGHVAVVAHVLEAREILITHANWGRDLNTRGVIHERQPVHDVSISNDWSLVRLKNYTGQWGLTYATHGFIYQLQSDTIKKTKKPRQAIGM